MGSATTPKKSPPASDWMVRKGETDEEERGGGGVSTCVKQDAKTAQTMKMRGMCFSVCYADLSVCRDS